MIDSHFAVRLFAMLLLTGLAACTVGPPTMGEGPPPGTRESIVLPRYQELIAEESGWRVYELVDSRRTVCMALKAVEGTPWPSFESSGPLYPRFSGSIPIDYKAVSGGAGFFMYIVDNVELPHFGFYGKHPYRLPSVAELDGKTIVAVDERDTVLSWEGKRVSFSVPTQPSQDSAVAEQTSGSIDFTGVQRAYGSMLDCHRKAQRAIF